MSDLGQFTWMREMLDAVDKMDADGFSRYFAPGCKMRYGNGPEVVGPTGVRDFSAGFFAGIDGICHQLLGVWRTEGGVVCQGECSYKRKDGTQVTLPFMTFSRRGDAGISEYLVYMDPAPIFAPSA
jgi:hypothetical protein